MAKIATLSDKQTDVDAKCLQIDIKNIRVAINDLYDLVVSLQAQIDAL